MVDIESEYQLDNVDDPLLWEDSFYEQYRSNAVAAVQKMDVSNVWTYSTLLLGDGGMIRSHRDEEGAQSFSDAGSKAVILSVGVTPDLESDFGSCAS